MVAAALIMLATAKALPKDIDGHSVRLSGAKATVAFVVIQDCPIARQFSPEINRIADEYSRRGIKFLIIHAYKETTVAQARTHRTEFGLRMPVVIDNTGELVRLTKTVTVPTAAVFDVRGKLVYSGRIDDRYPKLGILRSQPTRHDLRIALDQILSHQRVIPNQTAVVGCVL